MILSSKLPNAKKFKHWVTSEVLPAIRKHGMYAIDDLIANPDLGITALNALKEEREKNKKLEEKMNTLIKETKTIENNYISSIESSKNLQSVYKEVSNQIIQMVKESLYDMSNKYKTSLFGILGLFKVPFQVTLNNLIKNIETIIKSKEIPAATQFEYLI